MAIRVTVWNENIHEQEFPEVRAIYPKGIHGCIADFLAEAGFETRTATLQEPEHGLTQEVLDNTDVLTWWGHLAHHAVSDEVVERVFRSVDRPVAGDDLCQLLFTLGGVRCPQYRAVRDITSPVYRPARRMVSDVTDYDALTREAAP